MIESISVSNFYCFKERTELNFIASKERNRSTDQQFCGFSEMNKVNLLKMVYLLGNNGAGKSKVLSAFNYLQYLVATVRDKKEERLKYIPFAFDSDYKTKPSQIELVYHISDKRFRYTVSWNKDIIQEEKLCELSPRKEIVLFNRWYDEIKQQSDFNLQPQMQIDSNSAYIIKSALLPNNSLISIVSITNISNPVLNQQLEFFSDGFEIIDPENIDLSEDLPDDKTEQNANFKSIIIDMLRSVDTNIVSYEKLPIEVEYPKGLLEKLSTMSEEERIEIRNLLRMDEEKHTVNTFHKLGKGNSNRRERLPLTLQSEGTKEILKIIVIINEAIRKNKTIILDDYRSGIQRDTLNMLLKFFLGASTNSQLIFATQDYSMVNFDLFRRDSIRFLIKNEMGESRIENIRLAKLHKNTSLLHYISKINTYSQLPEVDEDLFDRMLARYIQLN